MHNHPTYRQEVRHVERKISFFMHMAVFIIVNSGLMLLNQLTATDRIWSFWPLFGWGIGLLFHALAVFVKAPASSWKRHMIENELKKQAAPRSNEH